jgi:surfactin synthase thioesterase subunit
VAEVVGGIADAVVPELDRPWAIFGHSLGALLGFELVRELRRRGARLPALLVASARRAPHLPKRSGHAHALSDADLVQHLRELNGTPEEILANAELMELVLPIVRADLEADETYACGDEDPLEVPVLAFGGAEDRTFPLEDLVGWAAHTRGGFDLKLFPGDHFFLHGERAGVLDALSRALESAVQGPTAPGVGDRP